MKKRLFAALLSVCLLFTLLPATAFAEGEADSGTPPVQSALCEHHPQHDESCGYTEGTAEIPCSHEHTEDCYTLVTECVHEHTAECYPAESVSENTATPSEPEEAEPSECTHECSEESGCMTKILDCKHEHKVNGGEADREGGLGRDEACGYVPATEGTPCTFVCEVCNAQDSGDTATPSDAQPEKCTCETLCTEEEVNADCPVCSAEGAELDKVCIGAAPMLAAAAPLSSEHPSHDGWKEISGIWSGNVRDGNYVLTDDVTLLSNVTFGGSICLNGHKIYGNGYMITNTTICDCTGSGSIYNAIVNSSHLSDVSLRNNCTISGTITIDGHTNIYDGCSIIANNNQKSITINSDTSITTGVTIQVISFGTLSFNGGVVRSNINVDNLGTCNIGGTAVINTYTEGVPSVNITAGGTCNISGTAKIGNSFGEDPDVNPAVNVSELGTCNITGGTISSRIVNEGTCDITGGTISSSIEVSGGACNITGGTIKVYDYTSSGETTGAVVVKNGSCNIGGDAQITGNRIDNGGAVSVIGGSCTISGGNINKNNTKYGGVYVADGTCTIEEDAGITSNQAFDQGGGVYVAGGVCDIYGTIGSNYTAYNYDGDGGGVYVAGGECNIYGKIYNNTAKRDGGGVYVADGNCNIAATSINYNEAAGNGGGIYVAGGECRIATQTIGLNEAAGNGGGVYVASGAKVTVNNTSAGLPQIKHNTAAGNGGGVYLCEGAEWLNLCDVTYNTAQYGGGIYSEGDCKLTIRNGSVEGNTATIEGGGLYLNDSQTKPCIVEITNWTIKENKDNSSQPNNMVSLNSQITYEQGLSTQDTLPYEEPGSIILKDSASFTIMSGKYKASEISSCFTRQSDNKILIAGGYYDADPSKEPTLTVVDGVKAIELDGDIGYNRYDPNYPWAVYPVKDGMMSGTSNNPVYNGAPIEQDSGFSLSGATDIQKFYYWHKSQGAEDSSYVAGLPSDAGDYTIKVGGLHLRTIGEEYYTECTFDLTIAKADPSYTVPAGITAQVGKPLSTVTLPEGWAWKDESTIPQTEGTQTYPAIFTPDDTDNYNTVETDISVGVVNEPVVQEYAITFDANGGSVSPSSAQTKNGKLESLPTPTRGGYDFLGWYTQKDGGDEVTTDTVFTKDTTIYAHWQKQAAQEYTVTFDANGGSVNPSSATTKDGKVESLPTPTRGGYDFLGWYTQKDGGEKVITDTVFTKDTTIYAHWQKQAAQEYTVTFDANGGSVNPSSATTKDGKLESLPTPTHGGYDFLGWYTEETGGEKVTTDTVFTKNSIIYAHWQEQAAQEYTVTFNANGGSVTPSSVTTKDGKLESLPTPTRGGYDFLGWYTQKDGGDKVTTNTVFTKNSTIYAHWQKESSSGGGGGTSRPTPSLSDRAIDDIRDARPGDTVEITLRPGRTTLEREVFEELAGQDITLEIDAGDGVLWTVNGMDIPEDTRLRDLNLDVDLGDSDIPARVLNAVTGEIGTVQLSLAHDGEFGFTMTLSAPLGRDNADYWANLYWFNERTEELEFQQAARIAKDGTAEFDLDHASDYAIVIDDRSHEPVDLPFTDVPEGYWAYGAIQYVYGEGLMAGTSGTTFAPENVTTRGQIVTILWRMAGSPQVNYLMDFSDVDPAAYYGEAIRWATSEGIAGGYGGGVFGPDDPITREQLAVMLHRYAQHEGYDVSVGEDTNILSYTDAFDVSEYAVSALQWACGAGIIHGTGDGSTLTPQGVATRAQAAVILMRFCELDK